MKESTLVSKIIRTIRLKYPRAFVWKTADRFRRGLPDILVLFRRHVHSDLIPQIGVLWIEVKAPGGKLKGIQKKTLFDLRGLGDCFNAGCLAMAVGKDDFDPAACVLNIMSDMGAIQ